MARVTAIVLSSCASRSNGESSCLVNRQSYQLDKCNSLGGPSLGGNFQRVTVSEGYCDIIVEPFSLGIHE